MATYIVFGPKTGSVTRIVPWRGEEGEKKKLNTGVIKSQLQDGETFYGIIGHYFGKIDNKKAEDVLAKRHVLPLKQGTGEALDCKKGTYLVVAYESGNIKKVLEWQGKLSYELIAKKLMTGEIFKGVIGHIKYGAINIEIAQAIFSQRQNLEEREGNSIEESPFYSIIKPSNMLSLSEEDSLSPKRFTREPVKVGFFELIMGPDYAFEDFYLNEILSEYSRDSVLAKVSYNVCCQFTNALSEKTGRHFILPSRHEYILAGEKRKSGKAVRYDYRYDLLTRDDWYIYGGDFTFDSDRDRIAYSNKALFSPRSSIPYAHSGLHHDHVCKNVAFHLVESLG